MHTNILQLDKQEFTEVKAQNLSTFLHNINLSISFELLILFL